MKVRIGKAFLDEVGARSGDANPSEKYLIVTGLISKGKQTKTGVTVEVAEHELKLLISECEWFVHMNSPECAYDDRRIYNNLRNQLKAFQKAETK